VGRYRAGALKNAAGRLRRAREALEVEVDCYDEAAKYLKPGQRSDLFLGFRPSDETADLFEGFAGHASLTMMSPEYGLRALQPADSIYGWYLDQKDGMTLWNNTIEKWKPLLVVTGFPCTDYCIFNRNIN